MPIHGLPLLLAGLLTAADGPGKPARSDDERPPRDKTARQYHVHCTLVKVDPTGTDFGEDGGGNVLGHPVLLVAEGQDARFSCGSQVPVPADNGTAVEFLEIGHSFRVQVNGLQDGRVRLAAILEGNELKRADRLGAQVSGKSIRSIAWVKFGEEVKLVEEDERGHAQSWLKIRVVKEDSLTPRPGSTGAVPATPSKEAVVGKIIIVGNDSIPQETIRRLLPLHPGQILTHSALRSAERVLEKLDVFRVEPAKGVRPTVSVLDAAGDSPVKDILIIVEEKLSNGLPGPQRESRNP